MSKKVLNELEEQSCEIIELAINEVELLTQAFDLISEICKESDSSPQWHGPRLPERLIN